MKNNTKYFAIAMIALLLVSFKKEAATPKSVTESFLLALSVGDFDKAKTMVTKDSEESIDAFKTFGPELLKGKKFTVTKQDVQGDNATVTYTQEGEAGEKIIKLIKVDKTWKIMFDKNEFTGSFD